MPPLSCPNGVRMEASAPDTTGLEVTVNAVRSIAASSDGCGDHFVNNDRRSCDARYELTSDKMTCAKSPA